VLSIHDDRSGCNIRCPNQVANVHTGHGSRHSYKLHYAHIQSLNVTWHDVMCSSGKEILAKGRLSLVTQLKM